MLAGDAFTAVADGNAEETVHNPGGNRDLSLRPPVFDRVVEQIRKGLLDAQRIAAHDRLAADWDRFVVPGLGVRCVADRPWVTGAETCELALALAAVGRTDAALEQVAAMQHLRHDDGSYWTGLVFADGVRWPVERTTWTAAAVVLAADALSGATPAAGLFSEPA